MIEQLDPRRFVMETVAELHRLGYGQLKIGARRIGGMGNWWYYLYAHTDLIDILDTEILNRYVYVHGGYPSCPGGILSGKSIQSAARMFIKEFPELAKLAKGDDKEYVEWYRLALKLSKPNGYIITEGTEVIHFGEMTFTLRNEQASKMAQNRTFAMTTNENFFSKNSSQLIQYARELNAPIVVYDIYSTTNDKYVALIPESMLLNKQLTKDMINNYDRRYHE